MQKISKLLHIGASWLLSFLIGAILLVTLLEIFSRNVLGQSFQWSEELSRFLLVWITFIGASVVYKKGELIALNAFSKARENIRMILFYITQVITILFICVLFYFSMKTTFSGSVMNQMATGFHVSMVVPYISIPIGLIIMLIHAIAFLLKPKELMEKEEEYTL